MPDGRIDYSRVEPRDRWELLDDLETIAGNSPSDIADLRRMRPYAIKFGAEEEFRRRCEAVGANL